MKWCRIFWTCETVLESDGYYYHRWRNYLWVMEKNIFAGYTYKALRKKSSTFKDLKT